MEARRSSFQEQETWDVASLYPSFKEWELDFAKWGREGAKERWPEIASFCGRLHEGADRVLELFKCLFNIQRALDKLSTYAHLRHDEDVSEEMGKRAHTRAVAALHAFRKETAWVEPELLHFPQEALSALIKAPQLAPYAMVLDTIVRLKPHTLSDKEEALLALADNALEAPARAFGSFNNADLTFPKVQDSLGKEQSLTHATYQLLLRSKDRLLRKGAFEAMHTAFYKWENTLADLIQGQVQAHLFKMRARTYKSCLDAALFPHQIDSDVYISLIERTRGNLFSLHSYMELRKKALGLGELHLYDLAVPLAEIDERPIPYDEAVEKVIASVAPLGEEYQRTLAQGLKEGRWVDRYENKGKRSGAYSSGCYDSAPFILLNYANTFRDLMTLAHEAGHSMHSLYSNRAQPYQNSRYPIFLAEVASTFHEELLFDHLLNQAKDPLQRAFLLNQRIDDMRSTFFRQVMFAEFEFMLHEWAAKGVPLTPGLLKEEYRKLNVVYFGKSVVIDDLIEIEWARIPHFYYNFYVYQYATGISAACALCEKVKSEGESARAKYLKFLSSGSSNYPLELLKEAGVDMNQPAPIVALLRRFDALVKQLEGVL